MPRVPPVLAWSGPIILCFTAGWIARARVGAQGHETDEEAAVIEPGQMAVPVVTATVEQGSLPRTLPILAVVRPSLGAEHVLSSRSGGRIRAVHGVVGAEVHAGDVLVEFEREPLEAAKIVADAESSAAQLALDSFSTEDERKRLELEAAERRATSDSQLATSRAERLTALVEEGLGAQKALDEARSASAQAARELDLATQARLSWTQKGAELERATRAAALEIRRAAAREAAAMLDAAALQAPADGQLVRFDVRAGDRLEPGADAGTLLAHTGRELVCGVLPRDLSEIRAGQEVRWLDAGVRPRMGRVIATGGALDPASGTVELRIAPEPGPEELPGEIVRGEIVLEDLQGVLLVPQQALVRARGESAVVRVGQDGLAHAVQVVVLARHAELAAVQGDLAAGDTVVVEGAYNLPEGARTLATSADAGGPPAEPK